MAGAAERVLVPERGQRARAGGDAPGLQPAVGRIVADDDAALAVDQWRVGDAAAGQAADGQRLQVGGIVQRDPDQAVRAAADPGADHAPAVAVLAVVHPPGVAAVDHRVPAMGLATLATVAEVVGAPVGVGHQPARRLDPVVAQDRPQTDDIDRVADRAEPGHRRLGAQRVGAGRRHGFGVDHRQPGRVALRQVLADDQPVVQDHEGVVGLVQRQTQRGQRHAAAVQPVQPAAVDDIELAVAVQRHAARPHRPAGQPRRALQGLERARVYALDTGGGGQADMGAQRRMAEQVDLAGRAQQRHGRQQRVAGDASQGLAVAQRQAGPAARHLQPRRAAVLTGPGAGRVTAHGRRRRRRTSSAVIVRPSSASKARAAGR